MSSEIRVPFFKKGKARAKPTTTRVRSTSPENAASSSTTAEQPPSKSQVVLPSKKATSNLLSAGSKRKRVEGAEDDEEGERDGPDMKWSAEGSHVDAAQQILAGDEIEELMAKRRRDENDKIGYDSDEVDDDGKYHGQSKYQKHLKKSKDVPKAMRVGPQRASGSTIRTVTITDYQPDVCKDYKGMWVLYAQ
jgi:RING finger protein 113A